MKSKFVITIICLGLFGAAVAEDYASLNNDGNTAFAEKDFKTALDLYRQAEVERPETPEIYYNQANALIESQNYEEAINKFAKALNTEDLGLQAGVYYNGGNGYFKQDSFQTAIEWYQKALELDPQDLDTKHNLELARNRLKEQMERQQKDGEGEESGEKKQQEDDQEDEQEKQQDKDMFKDKDADQPDPDSPFYNPDDSTKQQEKQQTPEGQPAKADEMSKEDAMRILQALEDSEKENQKKVKRFKIKGTYVGSDW